eukprot:SAG31_NODE_2543_length_5534_cov_9.026311_1_plen_172_part_00
MDPDGDGEVTFAEFEQWWENHGKSSGFGGMFRKLFRRAPKPSVPLPPPNGAAKLSKEAPEPATSPVVPSRVQAMAAASEQSHSDKDGASDNFSDMDDDVTLGQVCICLLEQQLQKMIIGHFVLSSGSLSFLLAGLRAGGLAGSLFLSVSVSFYMSLSGPLSGPLSRAYAHR